MQHLLSPALVGRRPELQAAARALDTASGPPAVIALIGDAGIGKTRLRREITARTAGSGLAVLAGRTPAAGGREPFHPLAEAVADAYRDRGPPRDPALLPLLPTLAHLVPAWTQRPAATVSPLAIAEALLRLLAAVGPAVLALEDLHWADTDTLTVVRHLAVHRDQHRASLLLTLRPTPPEAAAMVRRLATERDAVVIEVGPLADDDVDALVRACLGADAVASELLEFVRERADGVPFLVEELLAGAVRAGALVRHRDGWQVVGHRLASTVPATLAESIGRRLRDLAPRTQQVLFAAALLGRRFDWRLLPAVTGQPEEVVLAALREAAYAQLVVGDGDSVRFRHALTREHIIDLLLPPERAALAARAAAAVEAAHPGLPGRWLDSTADLTLLAGDHAAAAALLTRAGVRARRRGALATAAGHLERARALAPDDAAALLAQTQLAQVRALAGDVAEAEALGRDALDAHRRHGEDPAAEVELELALARAAVTAGRAAQARSGAERAAQRARELADRVRQARATALAAHAALEAGDLPAAQSLAAAVLDDDPPPDARCEALEVTGRCARLHDLTAAEAAFTAQLETATAHDLALWRARALHELGTIDLLTTLRTDRLQAARVAAIEAGVPATAALADHHLASALAARGEPDAARAAAERAVSAARRLDLAILPFALVVLATTHAQQRRVQEMERALADAAGAAAGDPAVEAAAWGHARATLALQQADLDGARAALDRAVDLLAVRPDQHFPRWGLWALLRTLADNDGAAARQRAAHAAGSDTVVNRALLAVAEAVEAGRTGDAAAADDRMAAGMALLAGYEHRDWLVHTTRWMAASAALDDRWGDPVTWLQAAVRWFAAHGHGPQASACRVQLRAAGAAVPRPGSAAAAVPDALHARGVTSREMDVLALVASGLTNRQIAERLVLSPKTVEKHVSRLLAKTGAADRRALAVWGTPGR